MDMSGDHLGTVLAIYAVDIPISPLVATMALSKAHVQILGLSRRHEKGMLPPARLPTRLVTGDILWFVG